MIARRAAAGVIGIVVAVTLTGCVSSGVVTDRSHSEAWTSCTHVPTWSCTKHQECWRLHLRSNRGDLGAVCVPPEVWQRYPIGSYYQGGGS